MTESLYEQRDKIALPRNCTIDRIRVLSSDPPSRLYRGDITLTDHIERFTDTDEWSAKAGGSESHFSRHVLNGRVYWLEIVPKIDLFGDRFTIIDSVDQAIRHHIVHAILAVDPNLPFLPLPKK